MDKLVETIARSLWYGREWTVWSTDISDTMEAVEAAIAELDGRHGWKLVPVEPTAYQQATGVNAAIDAGLDSADGVGPAEIQTIYYAMFAAAPDPLAPPDTQGQG